MIRKLMIAALACGATATMVSAEGGCPLEVDGNDVEARAVAVATYADAYGIANGHYLMGTADTAPPTQITHPDCGPGGTTIGRVGYVGSFEDPSGGTAGDGNDMVAIFVFNADEVVASANKHTLRFRSIQNFVGNGYQLTARVMQNRGDVRGTPGARGVFNRTPVATGTNATATEGGLGPFGAPNAGVLSTVVAEARADRGEGPGGSCAVAGLGALNVHDSGSGVVYATFDRDADVALGPVNTDPGYNSLKAAIVTAQESGVSYTTCRFSCTAPSPLIRNVGCDVIVRNPLYIGVTATHGGSEGAAERLQDSLTVDNIIHLTGDSDFCGEPDGPGTICSVALVSKT